jgi:site-specific DNA-methyltransferase (adenine-specific)
VARRPTATSNFGVSRRENHDATAFYARFVAPELSDDDEVSREPRDVDEVFEKSATRMDEVPHASVALVVTSPPYFAGKEYEEALGHGEVPSTYLQYLDMLGTVFAECVRKLEPGGRIAVNVANLGRRPYRSLSSDVVGILERDLKLLLRGEVIWQKARGSAGSCAWGSFQKATNPVLRDLTERVVIASKGRFDRALTTGQRKEQNLPFQSSLAREQFMDGTTDVWEMAPESARRVNHPAPFPVELPLRLIDLYTYKGDLVLDPFMGSGTTAVAAVRAGRHFVGYDTDPEYVRGARARAAKERERATTPLWSDIPLGVLPAKVPADFDANLFFQSRSVREGKAAKEAARELLETCGFSGIEEDTKLPGGLELNFRAVDRHDGVWYFDVSGAFSSTRPGLKRTDTLWKALGKALVLHSVQPSVPLVLLTTDVPARASAGDAALQQVTGPGRAVADVVEMSDARALARLQRYAVDGHAALGEWR